MSICLHFLLIIPKKYNNNQINTNIKKIVLQVLRKFMKKYYKNHKVNAAKKLLHISKKNGLTLLKLYIFNNSRNTKTSSITTET